MPGRARNQPANPLTNFQASELAELGEYEFVWLEQTALTYLLGYQTIADFSEVLTSLPRVIYSSDLGQTCQMNIHNWHRYSEKLFNELAISPPRRQQLQKTNAERMLRC